MKPFASAQKSLRGATLDALLHPAAAYGRPAEVMRDADLTTNEKRAILAAWASDACAVEASPSLRCAPGSAAEVTIDEILDALGALDAVARDERERLDRMRRLTRRRSIERLRANRRRASRRSIDRSSATF
jgi:hypothetical protein